MKIVCGVLCALMVLFVAVQYNDPDGPLWMLIYGVGAVWAGLAAARLPLVQSRPAFGLLIATLAAAIAGMVYYWPKTAGWWRVDIWWDVETAREGMGMMILAVVLAIVVYTASRRSTPAAD